LSAPDAGAAGVFCPADGLVSPGVAAATEVPSPIFVSPVAGPGLDSVPSAASLWVNLVTPAGVVPASACLLLFASLSAEGVVAGFFAASVSFAGVGSVVATFFGACSTVRANSGSCTPSAEAISSRLNQAP
jgi:hypothetical protein